MTAARTISRTFGTVTATTAAGRGKWDFWNADGKFIGSASRCDYGFDNGAWRTDVLPYASTAEPTLKSYSGMASMARILDRRYTRLTTPAVTA